MRHPIIVIACLAGAISLSACGKKDGSEVNRAFQDVNVVDESNMSEIMLTVADPNEAVAYFKRTLQDNPGRIDIQRGLGQSLIRAKRSTEALPVWESVVAHREATDEDRVEYADALIRAGDWARADQVLDRIPPTYETYNRYRLEAMVADSNKEWQKADSFYEVAAGLTTTPAGVLNNWGYSKLTRGDYAGAERLFGDALKQDQTMFTAKNNLVLARGAQRKYTLPVIQMTQVERAQLLQTMGLTAVKQGDVETGKALMRDAISTHPQHFEEAVRALRALES